jgi:hypothetical protein
MSRIPVQRVRRSSIISAVRVAVATVVLCGAAYTSAATLWVNDDATSYAPPGTSCLEAGYATIQGAVDAASPGDTIDVCAGVYDENVVILTDDLTLVSTSGATATIIAPTTSAHVIEVRGTGLTLEGFTIVAAGFDDPDIGINMAIEGDTGATIVGNVIRGGRIGINLGCVSFGTTIEHNNLISQTEAGINVDTCEAPPFPGSHDNSIHHNVACSITSTASIALGGSSNDNNIHHNVATTISSFGTGNNIHHNTTRLAIVDNSNGGNSLHHNTTDPSVCF